MGFAQIRLIGLKKERQVVGQLPACDEPNAAKVKVLLKAAAGLILLPVTPKLRLDSEFDALSLTVADDELRCGKPLHYGGHNQKRRCVQQAPS